MHPDATDPVALYEIGFLDAANQTLDLLVDVDLEKGVADTLRFGGFKGYRNMLRVAGWNVLSDVPAGTEEIEVTLGANETDCQRVYYGLAPEGAKATGALYVYDVSVVNPDPYEENPMGTDGKYRFAVAGAAPQPHVDDPPRLQSAGLRRNARAKGGGPSAARNQLTALRYGNVRERSRLGLDRRRNHGSLGLALRRPRLRLLGGAL